MTSKNTLRLDKWLWTARFYKTRRLAAEAISGGRIHLNEQRTKPGKEIKIGNHLSISKGPYIWDIQVVGINAQRRPAKEAVLLYEETPQSHAKRHAEAARRRQEQDLKLNTDKRPNKKQRRQIHRFKRE